MKNNIWMPFYPGDYLKDTAHLTLQQDGVYLRLILHYWNTQQPIPTNKGQCIRIVKAFTPEEQDDLIYILTTFFQKEDGVYRHKRIEEELQRAQERHEKATERGKKGAERRWKE